MELINHLVHACPSGHLFMKLTKNQIKTIDTLDAIGQENEHEGIRWTKHFMDEFDKKEWEKDQFREEALGKSRMTKKRYSQMLLRILTEFIKEMDKPSNQWKVVGYATEKGLVIQIKDALGRVYQRAFKPCGIPKIDLGATYTLLASAEDTMYNKDIKTDSGIYLK